MAAKENFEKLVSNYLKPYFKNIGFNVPGLNFYLKNEACIKTIQIQKSQWNNNEECQFTFNLGIFDPVIHGYIHPDKILKSPKPQDCNIEYRIGKMIDSGNDKWYTITHNSKVKTLADEIQQDFESRVFPFFNKISNYNELIEEYLNPTFDIDAKLPGDLCVAFHQIENRNYAQAKSTIDRYLEKWIDNKFWNDKLTWVVTNKILTEPNKI
jgi:hypothetical protein